MEDLIKLMANQPDFFSLTGATKEEINSAEQELKTTFATDYIKYLFAYGVASFSGHELTGICKSNRLNVIFVTIEERNNLNVPCSWYVLEQANIDGIVIWQDSNGQIYQTSPYMKPKKICDSLLEYIKFANNA